jgi:beta-mannosidase
MSLKKVINLDTGWIFRQADDDDGQEVAGAAAEVPSRWLPVSQFPTNIHLDLVSHGCIPDPFHGKNELEVAWVAEQSWIYQTTFTVPLTAAHHYGKTEEEGEEGGEEAEEGKDGWIPVEAVSDARDGNKVEAVPAQTRAELVFEGLDTYATVYLDGEEILRTDNMFTPARVDVTDFIPHVDGREHQLTIRFDSALLIGKSIMEEYPAHHWGCWNGDTSRLAVRKAQYHYV